MPKYLLLKVPNNLGIDLQVVSPGTTKLYESVFRINKIQAGAELCQAKHSLS